MDLEEYAIIGFNIVIWIVAAYFFLRSIYHFIKMLSHFRSKAHDNVSMFVPWLAPFLPLFFTDEGNFHRHLFFKNLGISFIFMTIFVGTFLLLEHNV